MDITGKIIQILPPETGEGRNGTWKKQGFVVETQEQYPKKIYIIVWGDKIDLSQFSENEMVQVGVNIESREYNNRWFTDVKAWRMSKDEPQEQQAPPPDMGQVPHTDDPPPFDDASPDNDLPF